MKAQTLIVALLVSLAFANSVPTTKAMPKANIICHICEMIVSEIENLLFEGNNIDQILEFVDDICQPFDNIVEGATAACEQFINTQLPVIIDELVHNQLSPYSVCQLLSTCPAHLYTNHRFWDYGKKILMWQDLNSDLPGGSPLPLPPD